MGKTFDHITDELQQFIGKQHMFFVATAPLSGEGHVNLSPKGMDTFRIWDAHRVGYLDLTGSGNETSAHIAENGRITFMFVAFQGSPNIVRLYGTGRAVLPTDAEWDSLAEKFPVYGAQRQIIVADIHRTSTSCGFTIPVMDYRAERLTHTQYWEATGMDKVPDYQRDNNCVSIDGMPTPLGRTIK